MTIYITGDVHGMEDAERFEPQSWEQRDWEPTIDDYLIVLGDVGCLWHTKPWELPDIDVRDQKVIDLLTEKPWTVLFIDGNHDNHETLADFDVEEWNGGLVQEIAPRLIHLMRGQVYDIEDISFFAFGGASSPDRSQRIEGESWWPEEMPDEYEYETGLANLEEADHRVDVVLTHTCPSDLVESITGDAFAQIDELTGYLQELSDDIDFEHWYFGHFHDDSFSDGNFTCLFDTIVELDEDTFEPLDVD